MALVEAFAIPVVLKAVDFLFGEAKEIMETRRKARQEPDVEAPPPPDIPLLEQDKETVLKRKIVQELAEQQASEIEALLSQIRIYQKNRSRLNKRVALEGGIDYAPIAVVNQLHAQEDAIMQKSKELATLLNSLSEPA